MLQIMLQMKRAKMKPLRLLNSLKAKKKARTRQRNPK